MASTINTELMRIEAAVPAIRTSIRNKSVDVPDTARIDALPTYIDQIGITYYTGLTLPASSVGKNGDIYLYIAQEE